MSIRLLLVRHGNTFEKGQPPVQIGSRTDLPLTNEGRNQAKTVGGFFLSQNIVPKGIYSGSLKRQYESAQIIAKELSLDNLFFPNEPALTEIDYGLWEGLTAEEIAAKWPEEYRKWTTSIDWPAGIFEGSHHHHINAIDKWLDHLRKKYQSGDTLIAVTSNGVIQYFRPDRTKNDKVKTGHFCELHIHPDSLTIEKWNAAPNIDTQTR